MANLIYLTLTGKKQGLISQGCSTYASIGNQYQQRHEDEIFVLSIRHSIIRNQNVMHHPLEFIKLIDKSSPLLGMAISDNEKLEGIFDFYRTSMDGNQEKYYTIHLRDASLVEVSTDYPHSITHNDRQPQEIISIIYKDIMWKNHAANTSGYSIWSDRIL
ncbi:MULTISPECIES: Hcp family type VI secretion system effector [Xenorhabdus]|uniref:Hcp family type VI secretion system effector n=1 Tax=Xenorhabdus TaxID=626 RepID=UPI000645D109|nr:MULTISPECIES: Hcp family type VI secretion system effector [Xenorhabdus]MBC8944502.1 hypothetical protein [Xenorhabdus indica]